ncbi:hypothetical protein ACQEUU_37660 [Nonomuraea sp. CA-218870]|uniref:hypothetical protein n=1 Tax=Nonomuraea sp. CA-218870 TaxID=3239998 RepID=UPI003D94FACD
MPNRIAAFLAAGVMAVGLSAAPANAVTVPKPSVSVADGCAPLSLNNPTRWDAQFHYRVVGNRPVGPVAVPGRSKVQRDLRPRYGSGALAVQWWARSHDWRAKAAAVRAAEKALTEAKSAQATAKAAFETREKALPAKTDKWAGSWDKELLRLQAIVTDPEQSQFHAEAKAKIELIDAFLKAQAALVKANDSVTAAEKVLADARTGAYWTRWHRGLVRVPECVTATPTPTPTATDEPTPAPSETPTEVPTEEPTEEPTPVPTVTETETERTIVIRRDYLPVRIDTGLGGTAKK